MDSRASGELDLLGYLRVLRRRWWVVALVPLLGGGAAYAQARSQTPFYRAQTNLLVERTQAEQLFNPLGASGGNPDRVLANQIRVIQSEDVRQRAAKKLGYRATVGASAAKDQDVITLAARATEGKRAAAIANAYATAYIDHRVESAKAENAVAQGELQRQLDDVQAQLKAFDQAGARANADTARSSLVGEVNSLKAQMGRLKAASEVDRGGVQVLQQAAIPTLPFEPRPARSLALGLTVGVLLGLSFAFLIDYLDDTIKDKEDLGRVAPDLPVLALIPKVQGWRNRRETRLVSLAQPNDPVAEAYRTLRTSIQFLGLDRSMKTVQITSAVAGEGKTTTLANLAIALSNAGKRVIVVCCDLRHPRIHEFFGLSNGVGFTSVLLGDLPLSEALQKAGGESQLRLLASGPPPPNPSELLSSARTAEILNALQAQADIVLIDCPPMLPVTDAAVLSHKVDATLLVASADSTTRSEFAHAVETLKQVEAPLIGCVLNGVSNSEQYGYRYGGYYRSESDAKSDRPREAAGL